MLVDRSYPILAEARAGCQRLYQVHGSNLPLYGRQTDRGILFLPGESVPLRIVAEDIYGNRSVSRVTLSFRYTAPRDFAVRSVPAYPSIPELPDEDFQAFCTTITGYYLSNPLQSSSAPGGDQPVEKHYIPYRISQHYTIQRQLCPGQQTTFSSTDTTLSLEFPPASLYHTPPLQMELQETEDGIHIRFEPDRLPVRHPFTLRYLLPDSFHSRGNPVLYSVDNFRNRKLYRVSEVSEGILTAELREITSLYITTDNDKPWIGNVRVGKDLAGNFKIIIPVRDSESGIDHRRSR